MKRFVLALMLVAGCAVPTQSVRLPEVVAQTGGVYLPWHARATAERNDVLKCVGLDTTGVPPTVWLAQKILSRNDTLLMAYYDYEAHAVVFSPIGTPDTFWLVFRHEMIHSKEHLRGHGPRFQKYAECNFWPIRSR